MRKAANPLLSKGNDSGGKSTANTDFGNHRPPRLGQKLVHNGKFSRSSKRNPCPICTRNKDDKCAFNAETIHCYNGSSFYPPQHLKLGDTVFADGIKWALVATQRGFSGNHHIFKPDRPKNLEKPRKVEKISLTKLIRLFNILSENIEKALFRDPSLLTLQQLEEVEVKVAEALAETKILLVQFKQFSNREILDSPQIHNTIETTKSYYHQLKNRKEQIKQFRADYLGEFNDNI